MTLQALTYVEIDVDYCSLVHGTLPCLAGLKPSGDATLGYSDGSGTPYAALFDGSTNYLTRGAGLTGAADSKSVTFSVWVKLSDNTLGGRLFVAESSVGGNQLLTRFVLSSSTNQVQFFLDNAAGSPIFGITSANPLTADDKWHHILFSVDLTNAAHCFLYIDDVNVGGTASPFTNDTVDWTMADWAVGALADGSAKLHAQMAELWFKPGTYLDLSVAANRRLFDDGNGCPVPLGSTGQSPTGSSALVCLNSPTTWATNVGTGGGFTTHGTLAAGLFATGIARCYNTLASCQNPANFTNVPVTLRFAIDTGYLPSDIDAIPTLTDVTISPGRISLGEDLGQRESVSFTFIDHPWPDTGPGFDKYLSTRSYNPYTQGTFWAKFRARQPYLQGRPLRLYRGFLGQELADMECRHYLIDSFTGPGMDSQYQLVAKDILKLLDGDQSQAPALSQGYLLADIADTDTSFTVAPTGIGALTNYAETGYAAIGGSEIVQYQHYKGIDADCLLMEHFDGSNGATTFTDSSTFARTATAVGNAKLTNTIVKFGATSALFDGTGDYITLPDSNDWAFAGDFTVDFWIDCTALTSNIGLFGQGTDTNNQYRLYVTTAGVLTFELKSAGTNLVSLASASGAIVISTAYHIAVVRSGNVWTLYINGVSVATATVAASIANFTGTFRIGSDATAAITHNGGIDEFRVSRVARWKANFDVPISAYTANVDLFAVVARGQYNTEAADHSASDRVQQCLQYNALDASAIVYDLMLTYGGLDPSWLPLTDWESETGTFNRQLYTTLIAEPTSVSALISELIVQCALAIWWDPISEVVKLQVLRAITTSAIFNVDTMLDEASLQITDQPDKRLSEVWVYFAQTNPLGGQTDASNYRSIEIIVDETVEIEYDAPAITSIFSRWIAAGGRGAADRLGNLQLGRYVNPPRLFNFDLLKSDQGPVAEFGAGYGLQAPPLQEMDGSLSIVPIQITRSRSDAAIAGIEAEEVRFKSLDADDLSHLTVTIDYSADNVNLRDVYNGLYTPPQSGDTITFNISSGAVIGSASTSLYAITVGTWPSGVTIIVNNDGDIVGCGGLGGVGADASKGSPFGNPTVGLPGGPAIFTRQAITLNNTGLISGGGGGGGGGGCRLYSDHRGGGGGGGGGADPGHGGDGPGSAQSGSTGTLNAGGIGGEAWTSDSYFDGPHLLNYRGGTGGAPGHSGAKGNTNDAESFDGAIGGISGNSIDGISHITLTNTGTIGGAQVN